MTPGKMPVTAYVTLFLLAIAAGARAAPESAGNWWPFYGPALGLAPEGLPKTIDFVDELTGTVVHPPALALLGLGGLQPGDKVLLASHFNGYWTVTHKASGRKAKIALGWRVRLGILPDKELPDGEVPEHVTGVVVNTAVLVVYEFKTAATAKRFSLDFVDGRWVLTLQPGGEKKVIAF
jgi:hypothetical protein